ncbi:MAG: PGA biosynthesis protein CapA [Parcubacteria group bacterium GW2011_GWC1_39_12]|nr:MAG: PGA biosynthesis protein CapA [Parcubacteria group bacterium GW2011_GWC1_39_12]KKR19104.1 MAG: PGA biosynthesis protein CapA [Parcubacteria group bacterium GW2011_GWF1_39_37]KKR51867.1 MAG: PGA biosynthesis protein CapA [Parcubacteria group bacterium GW2011_GWE1_40_20]KKS35755.1 MAG: PGA biosynthesis protein CapA [Parcubacteria group bacterium GW2011_GWE2_42_14]
MESNVAGVISKEVTQKNYPSVINFGDAMFDRGVRNIIDKRGRDPFEYIKRDFEMIRGYDIIGLNLEGPIVEMDRSKCQKKAYNFQFASTTPELLISAGINMVNIANNHSYDCFSAGFKSTKQYLSEAGIPYMGDSEVEKSYFLKTIDSKRFAFVGMDQTVSPASIPNYYPLIQKLKSENDFVIVNIHWGTEYELGKTEAQVLIAHKLIDAGADVIFGHHPHVVEPVEIYNGGVVFYSLGNFVFDQNFGDTMVGLGAGVEFWEDKKVFTIYPFDIKAFAPEFMVGDKKTAFCEKYLLGIEHMGCEFAL